MHEVGIMQSTLALAQEQARNSGAQHIHELHLRVGRLSGVVPDALLFAFETLRPDTLAAHAELVIEEVQPTCWCAACQTEFETPDLDYECPRCHTLSGELRRGTELALTSLEIS